MYLLYKRLESGDTPGLFEGWICVWICFEEARCSSPCSWGWGRWRGGEWPRKLPIWGVCDHPQRIRVREVSQNSTRREEGATQLDFKTRLSLGVRSMILEWDHLCSNPGRHLLFCDLRQVAWPYLHSHSGDSVRIKWESPPGALSILPGTWWACHNGEH